MKDGYYWIIQIGYELPTVGRRLLGKWYVIRTGAGRVTIDDVRVKVICEIVPPVIP